MNIKNLRWIVLATGILQFLGCVNTDDIFTDFDPQTNFSSYESFTWTGENPMITYGNYEVTSKTQKNIMDAVRRTLNEKGYRYESDSSEADIAVSIIVGASDGTALAENAVPSMLYDSDWRWAYKYGPEIYVNNFTKGMLAIDILDLENQVPVWHGRGSKHLSRSELQSDDDSESVNTAVRDILATLPRSNE